MAPIKFEENIKNKLEKRTINPSENAWSKLSNKLDEEEGKSNSKIVWWIGIAASLTGVFLVTTLFLNNPEDETISTTLVDNPIKDTLKQQEEIPVKNRVVENEEPSLKATKKFTKKVNKSLVNKEKVRKTKAKSSIVVANVSKEEDEIQNKNLIRSNTIINLEKIQEITAQILETEKDKNLVTDSEIESLLESAQKDIALNQIKKQKTKTVNANSLLEDVETDLEQTFRDKMFNTVISSYNTVKTAVVERNY